MIVLYVFAFAAFLAVAWLLSGILKIGAISKGAPIPDRPGTALVLVDLQTVFWDNGPYSAVDKDRAKAAILAEVDTAKAQGQPVIALRQEWSIPSTKAVARLLMKGQAVEGSAGVDLAPPFSAVADQVLVKRVQDGFETGELDRVLASFGVGALRIVGLDLNYCVQKTALAAAHRGFQVTVAKAGTLSSAPSDATERRLAARGVVIA